MSEELYRLADNSVRKCIEIASSPFQNAEPSWNSEAAFTLLVINLNDMLQALRRLEARISFKDDIEIDGDITDLVREMRNAVAHNGSILRMFDPVNHNSLHFGRLFGAGVLLKMDDLELRNPYSDDMAFFYGRLRLLLRRHIYRAVREADDRIKSIASKYGHYSHPWPTT